MAPVQPKAAAKPAAAPAGGVQKAKVGKPRNYDLGNGVVRFSKTKMFHKTVSKIEFVRALVKHSFFTLKVDYTMLNVNASNEAVKHSRRLFTVQST